MHYLRYARYSRIIVEPNADRKHKRLYPTGNRHVRYVTFSVQLPLTPDANSQLCRHIAFPPQTPQAPHPAVAVRNFKLPA
ncbi:hypothetical protein RR46_10950 [Papilio xuthus]|uniref:Uncharacterized protein n=1 Tax=Papilio xuthus TaxID=66420 RepID=A0A194PYK3_PAPXU|nr:hypothetical protein RR46_10950 [Papilio xuthus]